MGPPPGGRPERDVRGPAALWITDVRAEQKVDYEQQLRLLALNDASLVEDQPVVLGAEPRVLDAKTVALVRLAALVGVGGAVPSYSALADDAIDRRGHGRRDRGGAGRSHLRGRPSPRRGGGTETRLGGRLRH